MEKITIFVTVGTNHYNFDRMLKLVKECLNIIPIEYELIMQYGFSTKYVGNNILKNVKMLSRLEAEEAYAHSDLVFSHCGIGSIYNSLSYNRPTVIIPRLEKYQEFSDDHQLQIAKEIAVNPLIHMIDETLNKESFTNFIAKTLHSEKIKVDLTNMKLSNFINRRLTIAKIPKSHSNILTIVNAGGHLTQSLCVMKVVESFHLVTSININSELGQKTLTVVKGTQFNPFIHFLNLFRAANIIKKTQPTALFSTGGPICIPFALMAKMIGKKFIYLDTLSRVQDLSNTAKLLYKYRLASEIYCQWQSVADKYDGIEYKGKTFDIIGENNS